MMDMPFPLQETVSGRFMPIERKVHDHFVARGHAGEQAVVIARSFTHYMLGYVTEEGVAQYLVSAGVDPDVARQMVIAFRDAKRSVVSNH